jgi:hypothetical protein
MSAVPSQLSEDALRSDRWSFVVVVMILTGGVVGFLRNEEESALLPPQDDEFSQNEGPVKVSVKVRKSLKLSILSLGKMTGNFG